MNGADHHAALPIGGSAAPHVTPPPPDTTPPEDAGQARGERTRQRILNTALALFEEKGYERTTMRAIAADAGVSLGSAYYHFTSKEHLVQGFYDRILLSHREACAAGLTVERDAVARLRHVAATWVDVAEPYHQFAGAFFKIAAEPDSPMSPFSEQSAPARAAAVELYREVLAGADLKLSRDLAHRLPELLWLAQMGLVLFWVHDHSPHQARSRALVDQAAPMLVRLIRLTRLTPLRGFTRDFLALLDAVGMSDPNAGGGAADRRARTGPRP